MEQGKKKYQVEGKKGTKLGDFMSWDKKGSNQNASDPSSQKIPELMTEKR